MKGIRANSAFKQSVAIVLLACFTASCSTTLPKQYSNAEGAFSTETTPAAAVAPAGSYKKAIFDVPYEDVFQAVYVGVTQAQVSIESSSKSTGTITGERIEIATWADQTVQEYYFYRILVNEIGPEQTEVIIQAKAQKGCEKMLLLGYVAMVPLIPILGLGLLMIYQFAKQNSRCNEQSVVHWDKTSAQLLNRIMTFTRNNLVAAGAI